MIRREVGSDYFLITQDDHAELSGQLAKHWAGADGGVAGPSAEVILGTRHHDAGWPTHDDSPTLNGRGQPLDVFETPWAIALKVWAGSASRAAELDPYAGLLVSLHSLSLSARLKPEDLTARFALNKFQHREVERQEQLRKKTGMRTDLPLTLGLAEPGISTVEDSLAANFHLLQTMDLISLWICGANPAMAKNQAAAAKLDRDSSGNVRLQPWPFDVPRIELMVRYRRVAAAGFGSESEFRAVYGRAPVEQFAAAVAR